MVRQPLGQAQKGVSCLVLTPVPTRARVLGRLGPRAGPTAERLRQIERRIDLCPIDLDLRDGLARPFPIEPLRTLDALHLATALSVRVPGEVVGFACLDERLRANAAALGFVLLP